MTRGERIIFHCDMNAYFASVEELFDPSLRDVPMAICGNPKSRRGIIVAKNERAKAYGVKTAETIYQALKKCPELVLRPTRRNSYSEYCEKANAIYGQYTDLLERASIDESYLDVTGTIQMFGGDAEKLAHEIRRRIQRELGLTISVGVSYNKFFAKMASDRKKPDAVTMIDRENYRQVLWPLPIREMHMVGKSTEATLKAMNILTIGDLAQMDEAVLASKIGRFAAHLSANANGLDTSPVLAVDAVQEAQSIGNGLTFKRDLLTLDDFKTAIGALSDTVASRLRREGLQCATVQLTIKDPSLRVITRQRGLAAPTHLAGEIADCALQILADNWQIGRPVRLLTITAMKLAEKGAGTRQLSLFDAQEDAAHERRERLEQAVDAIREKYGADSINAASVVYNDLGIHEEYGPEKNED